MNTRKQRLAELKQIKMAANSLDRYQSWELYVFMKDANNLLQEINATIGENQFTDKINKLNKSFQMLDKNLRTVFAGRRDIEKSHGAVGRNPVMNGPAKEN